MINFSGKPANGNDSRHESDHEDIEWDDNASALDSDFESEDDDEVIPYGAARVYPELLDGRERVNIPNEFPIIIIEFRYPPVDVEPQNFEIVEVQLIDWPNEEEENNVRGEN